MTGLRRYDLDDLGVVGCAVVLFGLAWLPWYETRGGEVAVLGWGAGPAAVFGTILAMYAGGRVLLLTGRPQKRDVPVTPQAETFVACIVALLLVTYCIVRPPSVSGAPTVRLTALTVAAAAALLQATLAARKLGRTGVRSAR